MLTGTLSTKIKKLEELKNERDQLLKQKKDEASRVCIRLWDVIPMAEFRKGKSRSGYTSRLGKLNEYVDAVPSNAYEIIDHKIVGSLDEAWAHYNECIAAGEEGTMLKNLDHLWEDKRSKDLVKMKAELECDLIVVGWNQGTPGTKNEGKVGSLVCATCDGLVEVSISGFSDELRDEITAELDDWIGCIVTVKYNERISSRATTVDSLFLPRFLERRYDKTTADSSKSIK